MEQIIVVRGESGRIAENEAHISKVFEQLREHRPSGIRYASFKLKYGLRFVHFVSVETADGSNPLLRSRRSPQAQAKDLTVSPGLQT